MNSQANRFNRSLTLLPVVMIGLGYMAPMTVFSTYGVVAQTTHGMIPAAYLTALVTMLFTAYSYGKMVQAYPTSGSAYTYTQKSINPHLGFIVGWAVLMDYLFLPMINALLFGIFVSAAVPSVPSWVWIVGFIIVITILNIFDIRFLSRLNGLLVLFQFLVTAIFLILAIKGVLQGMGTGTLLSSMPFFDPNTSYSFVLAGASILCLSFLGFDAVTTLSEETINPKQTIPKAVFLVALIGGALFTLVSYIGQMVYPDYTSFQVVDSAAFEIAGYIGGSLFSAIFLAGMITACTAAGLTAHLSAARLLYGMGRESVLPSKVFAYVHPRFKTPAANIILIGVFSLSALAFDLTTASSFINFGALVAFTFVNISVVFHYYIRNRQRGAKGAFLYLVLPLIGAFFTIWLWSNLDRHSLTLGCIWVAIGIVYLAFLTKMFTKRPPEFHFEEADEAAASTQKTVLS